MLVHQGPEASKVAAARSAEDTKLLEPSGPETVLHLNQILDSAYRILRLAPDRLDNLERRVLMLTQLEFKHWFETKCPSMALGQWWWLRHQKIADTTVNHIVIFINLVITQMGGIRYSYFSDVKRYG